jgi:hypothetical protein
MVGYFFGGRNAQHVSMVNTFIVLVDYRQPQILLQTLPLLPDDLFAPTLVRVVC